MNQTTPFNPAQTQLRIDKLVESFTALGLDSGIIHRFLADNPSGHLPHHGNDHALTVSRRAVELLTGKPDPQANAKMTSKYGQRVALAGLYHDAAYSPGESEEVNIQAAIDFMIDHLNVDHKSDIARFIRATSFPHRDIKGYAQRCLQDADLLQYAEPDGRWFYDRFELETGNPVDYSFPHISMFNTPAGRLVHRSVPRLSV